jgi:hypothetical protein
VKKKNKYPTRGTLLKKKGVQLPFSQHPKELPFWSQTINRVTLLEKKRVTLFSSPKRVTLLESINQQSYPVEKESNHLQVSHG